MRDVGSPVRNPTSSPHASSRRRFIKRPFARSDLLVSIDRGAIPALLPWLRSDAKVAAWRDYVGEVATSPDELARLFHELALTVSQFGGFIGYRSDGRLHIWKRNGSGIKAILHVMEEIRRDRLRPGFDIHKRIEYTLAAYLIGAPFASERLDMMAELAETGAREHFETILQSAKQGDGSYVFSALHMMMLRTSFPKCFGGDGAFSKKASLLLMTMEIALKDLGFQATAYTVPPADYRIPQILEGLGILRFNAILTHQLLRGTVFRRDDEAVHAVRAATVEAVHEIGKSLAHRSEHPISTAELDNRLYMLSRNKDLMAKSTMKPHMLVATLAF